jgi:hypothetical protein
MQAPVTSNRKIAANRRNSRKSCGPRTAAGKSVAGRNALRHGLAAITYRQSAPSTEIEEFARALCGDDTDPAVFAQAVKIAVNEMELRAIRAQQVAVIERLRDPYLVPFAKKDNTLQLAKGRFMEAWLAEWEIAARVPKLLEKYKDQMPPPMEIKEPTPPNNNEDIPEWMTMDWIRYADDIVPIRLKALLQEPDDIDEPTRERVRKQIMERDQIEQRDEYEALETAVNDLIRLDRYQRRAWSRQKRAIREFIAIRLHRDSHHSVA